MNKTNQKGMNGKARPKRFMSDIRALFKIKEPEIAEDDVNMFYNSLAVMNENDIVLNEIAKDYKKPSFDTIRYFILLVLIGIMAYTGYLLVERLYLYVSAARESDRLRDIFWGALDNNTQDAEILTRTRINTPIQDILSLQRQTGERVIEAEVSEGVRDVDKVKINTKKISALNSDFYCWIKVSHTRIDYPVAQTTNNDYYLHRSFERKPNPSGAIFADYRNSRDIMRNRHTILYGHNMLDGSMFQPIIDFGRYREYFNDGIIELITEGGTYYYEIFSAREEDPRSGYIETWFETDEEWIEFLELMQERSNFNKNLKFTGDDRIVTLSTCVNVAALDWRFVVQGILIDVK